MTHDDQPHIGTWTPTRPTPHVLGERDVAAAAAHGATLGASMWFDADMVHALVNGATRAGWSATQDAIGRTLVQLETAGQRYYWVVTGNEHPHPSAPGRMLMEARWPD